MCKNGVKIGSMCVLSEVYTLFGKYIVKTIITTFAIKSSGNIFRTPCRLKQILTKIKKKTIDEQMGRAKKTEI